MAHFNRIAGIDENYQFPMPVRQRIASNLSDPSTPEGAAVAASVGLIVTPQEFGAQGDGLADDTTAINAAITAAMSRRRRLYFPPGSYVVSSSIEIRGATGFRLEMDGRLVRGDASSRVALLRIVDCVDFEARAIRTDGNAANNGFEGYGVDEAKHDVRVDNCTGLTIGFLDSVNPAGDSLYISGGLGVLTQRAQIGMVSSVSDAFTGRNAVTIIKGKDLQFGSILSINTGHPGEAEGRRISMPSGLDLEPNLPSDVIEDVTVDSLVVKGAGGVGIGMVSHYGQTIRRISIGQVLSEKLPGALAAARAAILRGVESVTIGSLRHTGDGRGSGILIDASSDISLDLHVANVRLAGIVLGPTSAVRDFTITGTLRNVSGHGVLVYEASDGRFDGTIKDHGSSHAALYKDSRGRSERITFAGDWARASRGRHLVQANGTTADWVLGGVRADGWPSGTRLQGPYAGDILALNCPGLNVGTAAPSADSWKRGTTVINAAPTAGEAPAWVCVSSGNPGMWKPMPPLDG